MKLALHPRLLRTLVTLLLLIAVAAQLLLHDRLRPYRPDLAIIHPPPSRAAATLMGQGDAQFTYRILAFLLETSGDIFGRFTSLKKYNYDYIHGWLMLMDSFDPAAHIAPALAAYVYAAVPDSPDKQRRIVDYLLARSRRDPASNWWWLYQATAIANHKLGDKALALQIANELANSGAPGLPMWARQMPAYIHEQMGDKEAAYRFMQQFLAEAHTLSEGELNFMNYYLQERVNILTSGEAPPAP